MTATTRVEPGTFGERDRSAQLLTVTGRIQGVGFRPAVARFAQSLALVGCVRNTLDGVTILVEGTRLAVATFLEQLHLQLPRQASIQSLTQRELPLTGRTSFTIEASEEMPLDRTLESPSAGEPSLPGAIRAMVPVDLRVCDECLAEFRGAGQRRAGDVMISCTQCGPRYSIIRALPYERSATAMAYFEPCPQCHHEYQATDNRRFHAQTVSCPQCGPRVTWLKGAVEAPKVGLLDMTSQARNLEADGVASAMALLRHGGVLALKGLGGYQLLVDATSPAAVARIRSMKQRPSKPLAVLVGSIEAARRCAILSPLEEQELLDAAGPIVVVSQRCDSPLAPNVAGGLNTVGLLLPTTALHARLADELGPLVATSGNLESSPLEYQDAAARATLSCVADALLVHDRPIERPIDDSVVRAIAGKTITMRLARGLAPASLPLTDALPAASRESIVALGGHQKAACAVWNGEQAVLGPYVGDLDSVDTRQRYVEQLASLQALYGVAAPSAIACDLHPDYFTTRLARERMPDGRRVIGVQHHHAHIAATMLEHRLLDRRVLGIAWDGTGWGPDGTIWGGEFLECSAADFSRRARLRPLLLPGGELAIRQPWRTAAWLLRESRTDGAALARDWLGESRWRQFAPLGARPWPGIWTSSIGRLFDAVATLILPEASLPDGIVEYEGQAAMLLEGLVEWNDDIDELRGYPLPLIDAALCELDWRPLVDAVAEDRRQGVAPRAMARRFHAALIAGVGAVAERFPGLPMVLGGGVFQNRWLVERLVAWANDVQRFLVFPATIPPNDGGLAAGQLVVALADREGKRLCV